MLQSVVRPPKTAEDIATGVRLARMYGKDIHLLDVTRVLRTAGVRYVVVGAHAANGYTGKPRTTIDVDVIVQFPKKAAKAVAAAFPDLVMRDTPVVIRFMAGEEEAIDLMKPTGSKLWARLLNDTKQIEVEGEPVHIPTLEGMLAAKFAAMASPSRRLLDKQQDGLDFARIVDVNKQIDLQVLEQLGELVYAGGGTAIVKLVDDARAGRTLTF
jgi:hypothetical protein